MNASAIFETESASRYIQTLCNHFGRKVQAQYDAGKGWVQFPFGRCDMTAEQHRLELFATAEDQEKLDEVVKIMTNHFERFAFREHPMLVWQTPSE